MAVKPASWGADRLFARLDIADSDYFPAITREQAGSIKVKYFLTRVPANLLIVRVKQVCAAHAVPVLKVMFYIAYAHEVRRMLASAGGGVPVAAEVAIIQAKWVGRGLSTGVLRAIAYDVFNILPPGVPPGGEAE